MLTYTFMALVLVGSPRAPTPACTLGGPPAEARYCGRSQWNEAHLVAPDRAARRSAPRTG